MGLQIISRTSIVSYILRKSLLDCVDLLERRLMLRKVTPDTVKAAASNLKDSKTDPTFNFSSNCIKNGPDNLFILLSSVIKAFLIHGKVTVILLLATLVPLIKYLEV